MFKCEIALGLGFVGLLGMMAPSSVVAQNGQMVFPPFVQNKASLAETAKAEAIIAQDPKNLSDVGLLCRPLKEIFAKGMTIKTPRASRAFDNLYYLGLGGVGAWAIDTTDGIIVIDALDNPAEAEKYIEGGLRSLGLEPARIKYVLVSHGHYDHFGGAKYLQDKFHAHVLMSPADWALMASTPKTVNGQLMPTGPSHDLDIADGEKLKLGDTTLTLYITPGHSPGTVSALIPVFDHGKPRVISFWGGTAFSSDTALLGEYKHSVERFSSIVSAAGAIGVISNHPVFDESVAKVNERAAHPEAQNPFELGAASTGRYYEVLDHCLAAEIKRRNPPD